jgi:hypothetical protein
MRLKEDQENWLHCHGRDHFDAQEIQDFALLCNTYCWLDRTLVHVDGHTYRYTKPLDATNLSYHKDIFLTDQTCNMRARSQP